MEMVSIEVKKKTALIIANFGGPRQSSEIPSFLQALLCDQEVIQTPLPKSIHRALFTLIAKKRAKKVLPDYESIGGKSPIFKDTENVAASLRALLPSDVYTFHRYLPKTHPTFIRQMALSEVDEFLVFPMFPQFSYATTGSVAKWFSENLPNSISNNIYWIKSYPQEPEYVALFSNRIKAFLQKNSLQEEESCLFFSAHGIPQRYVDNGDPYQKECEQSFYAISKAFPKSITLLAYQSKFGPGEWLRPYTIDCCTQIEKYAQNKKNVIFIPLAFTSDHLETLFEIEDEYIPIVAEKGYRAYRLPAFNDKADWTNTIASLVSSFTQTLPNKMLLRR